MCEPDGPVSPVPNGPSDAQLRIPGSIPQEKETPLRNLLPLKTGNPFSSDPRYSRFSFPLILSYHKVATVVFRHLPANTANFSNFNNFFHFFGYRPVNQLARMGPRGRGKPAHLLDGPVCPVPDGPCHEIIGCIVLRSDIVFPLGYPNLVTISYHTYSRSVSFHLFHLVSIGSDFQYFFNIFQSLMVYPVGRCLFTRPLPVLLYAQERIILPDQYRYNQTDHYFRSDPRQEYRS